MRGKIQCLMYLPIICIKLKIGVGGQSFHF